MPLPVAAAVGGSAIKAATAAGAGAAAGPVTVAFDAVAVVSGLHRAQLAVRQASTAIYGAVSATTLLELTR